MLLCRHASLSPTTPLSQFVLGARLVLEAVAAAGQALWCLGKVAIYRQIVRHRLVAVVAAKSGCLCWSRGVVEVLGKVCMLRVSLPIIVAGRVQQAWLELFQGCASLGLGAQPMRRLAMPCMFLATASDSSHRQA